MDWFERLVGFKEESPQQVRGNLEVDGEVLRSKVNGREFRCGRLEMPTLGELRKMTAECEGGDLSVEEVVANVQELHRAAENDGALFQVASQFNLLEMVGPGVPPEHGVGIYERDFTQGPACAIACGAATIYRNYFVEVNGEVGQAAGRQVDCLADLGKQLGNEDGSLWTMRNGYALATGAGLEQIGGMLERIGEGEMDALRGELRIGFQQGAGVTLKESSNVVSQAFCSALPVAYSHVRSGLWEPFARLVLEASYEATLRAGLVNREKTGSGKVYLTLLGGGAFGNRMEWIVEAMGRALAKVEGTGLEVKIVSYGSRTPEVRRLLTPR